MILDYLRWTLHNSFGQLDMKGGFPSNIIYIYISYVRRFLQKGAPALQRWDQWWTPESTRTQCLCTAGRRAPHAPLRGSRLNAKHQKKDLFSWFISNYQSKTSCAILHTKIGYINIISTSCVLFFFVFGLRRKKTDPFWDVWKNNGIEESSPERRLAFQDLWIWGSVKGLVPQLILQVMHI